MPREYRDHPSIARYRAKVRSEHSRAFGLHQRVTEFLEAALLSSPGKSSVIDFALDLVMHQSYLTHSGVALLVEHGMQIEAATLTRRQLELAIMAVYFGGAQSGKSGRRRAGKYMSWLWRNMDETGKAKLLPAIRTQWEQLVKPYRQMHDEDEASRSWGPRWDTMFRDAGRIDVYDSDYSFLSALAHGAGEGLIWGASQSDRRLAGSNQAGVLLNYASGYYLIAAEQWNERFKVLPQKQIDKLAKAISQARKKRRPKTT